MNVSAPLLGSSDRSTRQTSDSDDEEAATLTQVIVHKHTGRPPYAMYFPAAIMGVFLLVVALVLFVKDGDSADAESLTADVRLPQYSSNPTDAESTEEWTNIANAMACEEEEFNVNECLAYEAPPAVKLPSDDTVVTSEDIPFVFFAVATGQGQDDVQLRTGMTEIFTSHPLYGTRFEFAFFSVVQNASDVQPVEEPTSQHDKLFTRVIPTAGEKHTRTRLITLYGLQYGLDYRFGESAQMADYVVRIDHDVFLCVNRLLNELSLTSRKNFMMGKFHNNNGCDVSYMKNHPTEQLRTSTTACLPHMDESFMVLSRDVAHRFHDVVFADDDAGLSTFAVLFARHILFDVLRGQYAPINDPLVLWNHKRTRIKVDFFDPHTQNTFCDQYLAAHLQVEKFKSQFDRVAREVQQHATRKYKVMKAKRLVNVGRAEQYNTFLAYFGFCKAGVNRWLKMPPQALDDCCSECQKALTIVNTTENLQPERYTGHLKCCVHNVWCDDPTPRDAARAHTQNVVTYPDFVDVDPAIFWLHIPKCGSSFQTTLYHYACPSIPPQARSGCHVGSLENATYTSDQRSPKHRKATTEEILLLEFPEKDYCDVKFANAPSHHAPADPMFISVTYAMFREPVSRFKSAWKWNNAFSGWITPRSSRTALQKVMRDADSVVEQIEILSKTRALQGCQVKSVLGISCFEDVELTMEMVESAKVTVDKMAFVGIQGEWSRSLCLFHKMWGGWQYDVETTNNRPATVSNNEDADFAKANLTADVYDTALYEHILSIVNTRFEKYDC